MNASFPCGYVRSLLVVPALVGCLMLVATRVQGQQPTKYPELDKAMEVMADDIARYLVRDEASQKSICISTFTGPSGSTGGSRIVETLQNCLKGDVNAKRGIKLVEAGRGYSVTGKYMGEKRDGKFEIKVRATIQNALGAEKYELQERIVTNTTEALHILGVNADLSQAGAADASSRLLDTKKPEQPKEKAPGEKPLAAAEQAEKILKAVENPTVFVEQDRVVRASPQSPYGIEIVLKKKGAYEPCPVDAEAADKGTPRVDIDVSDIYAVRLYNGSSRNVGCAITIDGINIFAFSRVSHWREEGKMVIYPGKSLIKGWHHDGDVSHEFLVTNYGNSAAAKFGAVDGLGTITATFFEIIPPPGDKKGLEPPATGQGEKVLQAYVPTAAGFGDPVAVISVQYSRPVNLPPK